MVVVINENFLFHQSVILLFAWYLLFKHHITITVDVESSSIFLRDLFKITNRFKAKNWNYSMSRGEISWVA